jgi:hypothetical protein
MESMSCRILEKQILYRFIRSVRVADFCKPWRLVIKTRRKRSAPSGAH